VPILVNMKPTSANLWIGQIYNARDGSMYDAKISLAANNTLEVKGCALGGLFCGGENWTRYVDPAAPPAGTVAPPAPKAAPKAAAKGAPPRPVDFAKDPPQDVCSALAASPRAAH
jgi:hypothetical protein